MVLGTTNSVQSFEEFSQTFLHELFLFPRKKVMAHQLEERQAHLASRAHYLMCKELGIRDFLKVIILFLASRQGGEVVLISRISNLEAD